MQIPRVTEILRPYTHYDGVPKEIMKKAAERGTTVHALCAGIAKGAWLPDGMIGEEFIGYVNSFKKWIEMQVDKFVIVEKRFTDEKLMFTGQLDYVITNKDNDLYLVDIKTSSRPQKTYPVQMAAYDLLLRNNHVKVKGAIIVYLDKDGDYPNINLIDDLAPELHTFLCALDCWHYFNKRKKDEGTRSQGTTVDEEFQ